MTQRQIFHAAMITESVPSDSSVALQTIGALSGSFIQMGADAGFAQSGALTTLITLIQKEALVRGIADTFLLSAIPVFIALPLIFLLHTKKPKAAEAAKPAQPPAAPAGKPVEQTT
jgi:hypothetical protein